MLIRLDDNVPYEGELASKASHQDIVRNPEVSQFLADCDYLKPPSDDEVKAITARFEVPPPLYAKLPKRVIAIDGSHYEASIDDRLPSTRIGYVKIGSILIDLEQINSLRNGRWVDPFRVARLQESNSPMTFPLPGANIKWKGSATVQEGFRAAIDAHLIGPATRFDPTDYRTSLRSTLFDLAWRRASPMGTGTPDKLKIHRCPTCGLAQVEVEDIPDLQYCPECHNPVYPSDCLRIWEEVTDYQSNVQAMSRFMSVLEHLLPIHYIRYLAQQSRTLLSDLAFFVDGPLAVFGTSAWLHSVIMKYINAVNQVLAASGQDKIIIIGLQKSGQVVDHANLIERFLPNNRLFSITDDYRYKFIRVSHEVASNGFGAETYYGHDFILKTESGRVFVFGLPFPFDDKSGVSPPFSEAKAENGRYEELSRVLTLIRHFESDLFKNAVVPVALAHRYTAISLVPGGQVLDILTRNTLKSP